MLNVMCKIWYAQLHRSVECWASAICKNIYQESLNSTLINKFLSVLYNLQVLKVLGLLGCESPKIRISAKWAISGKQNWRCEPNAQLNRQNRHLWNTTKSVGNLSQQDGGQEVGIRRSSINYVVYVYKLLNDTIVIIYKIFNILFTYCF